MTPSRTTPSRFPSLLVRDLRNVRALCLALAALALGGLAVGCAGEASVQGGDENPPGTEEENPAPERPLTTPSSLSPDELALIELKRDAIHRGLDLGKIALADELNLVLEDLNVANRYQPTIATTDGEVYIEPRTTTGGVCPFLEPATANSTGSRVDCRTVSDRAVVAAYASLTSLRDRNPLESSFDINREENEFWYQQGMMTGMDNEAAIAVETLRSLAACDDTPSPEQSAFDLGLQAGRQLYTEELNRRFAETGQSGQQYPDRIVRIDVCEADTTYLEPARSRATERVPSVTTTDQPLCPDYQPATVDEINRLNEARNAYQEGVMRGIETEHRLAEEKIFRVVPCNVGDPLVLDLAGDGVTIIAPWHSRATFDLFGNGSLMQVAWVGGDDAFLVLDRDQNGSIDSGRELFGNFVGDTGYREVATGFDHLALYDAASEGGNEDGRIDARDAVFARLQLWQDHDQDGVSHPSELYTLPELGVAAIELAYRENTGASDSALTHRGTFVRTPGAAIRTGQAAGTVYDAWLQFGRTARR